METVIDGAVPHLLLSSWSVEHMQRDFQKLTGGLGGVALLEEVCHFLGVDFNV